MGSTLDYVVRKNISEEVTLGGSNICKGLGEELSRQGNRVWEVLSSEWAWFILRTEQVCRYLTENEEVVCVCRGVEGQRGDGPGQKDLFEELGFVSRCSDGF